MERVRQREYILVLEMYTVRLYWALATRRQLPGHVIYYVDMMTHAENTVGWACTGPPILLFHGRGRNRDKIISSNIS